MEGGHLLDALLDSHTRGKNNPADWDVVNEKLRRPITAIPQTSENSALKPALIDGMQGFGDCIHQRAVIRKILQQGKWEIWLKTPWPLLYHDLVGPALHLVDIRSKLRNAAKNAIREADKFTDKPIPPGTETAYPEWTAASILQHGSIVVAMAARVGLDCFGLNLGLPVRQEWRDELEPWLKQWQPSKPILVTRPLTVRAEWQGFCETRNPDFQTYIDLLDVIRRDYFVVSVADLEPGREWEVGFDYPRDVTLHCGELSIEALIALFAAASMVYTSSGFAVPLAQAVGTPVICLFGGYETSASFSLTPSPYLGIDTIAKCACFARYHDCDKTVDKVAAVQSIEEFIAACHHRSLTLSSLGVCPPPPSTQRR